MARRRRLADDQVVIRDHRIVHDRSEVHNGTKLCCRVKKGKKKRNGGWRFESGVTSVILRVDASARVPRVSRSETVGSKKGDGILYVF